MVDLNGRCKHLINPRLAFVRNSDTESSEVEDFGISWFNSFEYDDTFEKSINYNII